MTADDEESPQSSEARSPGAEASRHESEPGPAPTPASEPETTVERFQCPNCHFELTPDDVGIIIFEEATVYHCPICKKTMALMPRFPKRAPKDPDKSE